jgi:hypothetical protein
VIFCPVGGGGALQLVRYCAGPARGDRVRVGCVDPRAPEVHRSQGEKGLRERDRENVAERV